MPSLFPGGGLFSEGVSAVGGLSSGEVVLDCGAGQSWWLVIEEEVGHGRIVAGPFPDRFDAAWAAGASGDGGFDEAAPVYGRLRADGGLNRRPSPQDLAWLAHLSEQIDRLPDDWQAVVSDDDLVTTLVVEVAAALTETGLPLHDADGPGNRLGGACLTPEPGLGGIVVTWRQHDRMSVDEVHGAVVNESVHQVMNRALADVLARRGFTVEALGGGSGHLVRSAKFMP
ncbi:hypothetical protein [Geodermatophilus sp. DSM 44513]|uniref:hypothetical protein n=1 Tax=Geodermatophilus sp. DSM 44513 TaxID=1528104 RepID=UPI001411C4E3|nr:hypothetical protein [Geodermatophilus sp. DSM 44513]WNV75300.1 hypothetical protein RTG05_20330 [Geodermatophilus sp. DSM 44513]